MSASIVHVLESESVSATASLTFTCSSLTYNFFTMYKLRDIRLSVQDIDVEVT